MDESTRLEDLFHAARALPPGPERAAFLDAGCGSDHDLRKKLEILLRADAAAGEVLPEPAAAPPDRTFGEEAGTWIDRYRLLERIGEGGFGSVWMAEQREPVKRRVALKVIKLGMDTRQVIARFEAERQALALMDHPNIARVLDAGATETGRPFFVMELVRGLPILEYCDREQLDTGARLELFTSVCHAIQHAHQKGIIHRDIKPSNVLVTLHDGVPVPVVIDFGIAKATNQELTAKTLFTAHRQIVGTPAYMSPEQAELSGLDIDTRSDVYSLGVLLYELLTGTTPFDVQSLLEAGYEEMLRAIREEEPHKPSTRVSTLGQTAANTATRRRTDVKKLGLILRGDLDWIVMKCLEKARTRRYETANGLAADIQRHLDDEPVSARPPSARYRLQKAIKRHRAAALATGAVGTALVLGVIGTTGGMLRANQQRGRAERAEVTAQANADQAAYHSYVGFMLAADAAMKQGNYPEAKRLHQRCPERYRGWEWHHLDVALNLTQALEGHAEEVLAAAFSPDGRRIVSASKDHTLRLWDAESGATVRVLEGHTGSVVAVAFSPDGRRIVSGSTDRTLRLWDTATGATARVLEGHTDRVVAVACSPDGRRIVSTSPSRVRFWSAETGELLRVLESPCHTLAFSPDGRRLVSSVGSAISIRDAETGDTLDVLDGHSAAVTGVAFSPDGRRIVSSSDDNSLRLWDVETGDTVGVLNGHLSYTYSPAFSPDGRYIVSASNDGTLRLWEAETEETLRVLRGHGEPVLAAAFSPDGRSIVSGSRDRTLRLWSMDDRQAVQVLEGPARGVLAVAFSPDGRRIASGSQDSLVRIWDAATGDVVHVRDEHADKVFSVAFSPDGRRLVSGSKDALIIRDAATGEPIRELERRGAVAIGLAFSADSRRIFTSTSGDHALTIWDAETGETLRAWDTGDGLSGLAVSPDDRRIASVGARVPVKIWNAKTGELVRVLEGHTARAFGAAYSPDGRRLVTGGWDKTARIWDAETGEPLHVLKGHAWRLNGVAFSPDGRRIATSAWDHTVRIWDAETGAALHVLEGHTGMVYKVAFSPDGRRLVSASLDGTLRLWESRVEDVRSQVRGRLRRDRVRPRVSALFDEHGFLEPVLAALRADTSLSVEERQSALLMARADAARELDEQAWSRVDPDRADRETDVALGLRLARASLQRNTTSPDLYHTLAWALFANGLHDEAIAAAEKAHRLSIDQRWQHIPERMVEFQGNLERLRAQIDQGR